MRYILVGLLLALALVEPSLGGMEAQKVMEIKGSTESILVFLTKLPASFEAQVLYGFVGSGLVGMVSSWLWKWSKGQADGLHHFTPQYITGQVLWLIGSALTALFVIGFQTETGQFFGWLSVLWTGGFAGFSGELKVKQVT